MSLLRGPIKRDISNNTSITEVLHKSECVPTKEGRAMECLLGGLFLENWPRYNGTTLYIYVDMMISQ